MSSLWLQLRAAGMLVAARVFLRRSGTTATLRRLAPRNGRDGSVDADAALAAVRRAQRVTGGRCLAQAVALTALLRRAGADPVLVLGCHREPEGHWSAHAWVRVGQDALDPAPTGAGYEELAWCRAESDWVPAPPAS